MRNVAAVVHRFEQYEMYTANTSSRNDAASHSVVFNRYIL
jgi:hypothetical protein